MTRIFLCRTTLCLWRTFAIDYLIEGPAYDLRGAMCRSYDTILRRSVSRVEFVFVNVQSELDTTCASLLYTRTLLKFQV